MLGVLCARSPNRPSFTLSPTTFSLHHTHHHPDSQPKPFPHLPNLITAVDGGASIWRVIVPAAAGGCDWRRDILRHTVHQQKGEGSWNVAWDARPARWLHRLDLAYLLFGLCLVLDIDINVAPSTTTITGGSTNNNINNQPYDVVDDVDASSSPYRITGVLADGRCLFRAIAHGACLLNGEEAPDVNRQRELADELRAEVVDELLKRRKEVEWFIEEDFDDYVKRIQQPYVWGGEPELLMASHVLKKLISVFMKDRTTGDLTKIADYGEEYKNDKESPINVLFHGYGHYEILETPSS